MWAVHTLGHLLVHVTVSQIATGCGSTVSYIAGVCEREWYK